VAHNSGIHMLNVDICEIFVFKFKEYIPSEML